MTMQAATERETPAGRRCPSQRISPMARERELAAILSAYNEATEQLKSAHERLNEEVARLREELRRKNTELRRRERLAALGEMAAGLAHEIRNPLGGIALYASMLEKELADRPREQAAAAKALQAVRSLERLVSEILEFAQEHRLERQVCELAGILTAVEDGARPWAQECGATVTFEAAAFDVNVYCDPARLRQVLLNLVMNGVQAAGRGGNVRVTAEALPASRATALDTGAAASVEIEVGDDGPGISAENLERIFNPFFTTRASGTGLGLAIVHRIVEAHGGTVRAGNRREGGARFVVRLPGKGED